MADQTHKELIERIETELRANRDSPLADRNHAAAIVELFKDAGWSSTKTPASKGAPMAGQGIKLLTGTVRRWKRGDVSAAARHRPGVRRAINGREELRTLDLHYQTGDQPDAECLVIIADSPAELRRVREMLEGVEDE